MLLRIAHYVIRSAVSPDCSGFHFSVIFATLRNSLEAAAVVRKFSVSLSPICYSQMGAISDAHGFVEIYGGQTVHPRRRSQDQRQPRRCVLERTKGDCWGTSSEFVRFDCQDRFGPGTWQSLISKSPVSV